MEKRENLKPCPFCGVMPHIYWEAWKDISPDAGVWKLEANHKDSCYITHINGTNISGRSSARRLSQLVEWWNHREELCGNSEQLESGHEKDHVADPGKMVGDLISRQAAIDAFLTELTKRERKNLLHTWSTVEVKYFVVDMLEKLPSAQPEPLTDKEQRIFLAAMGREEKVCKQVDEECCREPYEDSLVRVCHEIIRKVKATLWET